VLAVLGVLGVMLNQVFIWPQVWRAQRSVQGIAAGTALAGLLARAAWSAYGVAVGDLALIIGNVTVTVGFALLLALLIRAGRENAGRLIAAAVGIVAVVALASLSRPVLAFLAVASAAIVNLPQMVRAIADRRRLAGVSSTTYWLIAAASTCWLLYGIFDHNLVISAPHFLLLPTAVVTATLASARPPSCTETATGADTAAPSEVVPSQGRSHPGGA
jgi:uncharacterized protein with PQ loop repeat